MADLHSLQCSTRIITSKSCNPDNKYIEEHGRVKAYPSAQHIRNVKWKVILTSSSQPGVIFVLQYFVITDIITHWYALLSQNESLLFFFQLMLVTLFCGCSHISQFLNKNSHRVKENTQVNFGWFLISWCVMAGRQQPWVPVSGHPTAFWKPHLHHLCTNRIPASHCHSLEDRKTGFSLWNWQRIVDCKQGDIWNVLSTTSKQQPFPRMSWDRA